MKQVTQIEAIALIESKSSTFMNITYTTSQDKLNKGRGKGKTMVEILGIDPDMIRKTTIANVLVGTKISYQSLVENRIAKEADLKGIESQDFESAGRTWGVRRSGAIVEHKGEYYLTAYFVSANLSKVSYDYEGNTIDLNDAKFDQFRKAEKVEGNRQIDAGIDRVVVPRDINIANIVKFTLGGETYEIKR